MSPKSRLSAFLVLVGLSSVSAAQDLIVCDFTGTSPAANLPWTPTSFLAPGATYSGWEFGAGIFPRTQIDDALGYNIVSSGEVESPLSEALSQDQFVGFTVTPPDGGEFDLGGLEVEFSIERQSFHAPRRYALMTNIAGFTEGTELFTTQRFESSDLANTTFRFFIPPNTHNDITGDFEVRLYAFGATYNHATALTAFSVTEFPGETFTLELNQSPGGTAVANPSSVLYREGQVVQVSSIPDSGFRFGGWSGSIEGLGNPSSLTMDTNKTVTAQYIQLPELHLEVGMNLASVNDYGSSWPFLDLMRRTRGWMTRRADGTGGFDTGFSGDIALDANGYPIQSPFTPTGEVPQIPHTILVQGFPVSGSYEFQVEGTGTLVITSSAGRQTVNATGEPVTATINVPDRDAAFVGLEIHATGPDDPLRNFHMITPGFEADFETQVFHPLFLERLSPFHGLRFMDWAETNASPLANFADRTTLDSFTQSRAQGTALEHIADLSNRLKRHPWICIPHLATDDYVRQTARLLRDTVDPDLKIYVEYSNETWNTSGAFTQTRFAREQGTAMNLDPDPYVAAHYFVALRSAQIWAIFEEEFGGGDRLINVLATQSANSSVTRVRVDGLNNPAINPRLAFPEALAIAPYFGQNYRPEDIANNGYPTVDELVTTASQNSIEQVRQDVQAQKDIANLQGYRLICYEGGQHFVGIVGAENDDTLTGILHALNRDPRMYDRYREYLTMLKEEGVEEFWHFSSTGRYGKFGSWGSLETQDQDISTAPKHRALLDFINEQTPSSQPDRWDMF